LGSNAAVLLIWRCSRRGLALGADRAGAPAWDGFFGELLDPVFDYEVLALVELVASRRRGADLEGVEGECGSACARAGGAMGGGDVPRLRRHRDGAGSIYLVTVKAVEF
jgi:hypothetical protein